MILFSARWMPVPTNTLMKPFDDEALTEKLAMLGLVEA